MDILGNTEDGSSLTSPSATRSALSNKEVQRQKSRADNVTWFTHGEFIWRSGASVVWLMLLLPTICMLYLAIVSFSLLHPIIWITDTISNLLSLWNLLIFIFIFEIIMIPVVLMNIKICSVDVRFGITRMSAIASFLTAKHLNHLVLCMLSGSVGCWWVSLLTHPEYGTFTHNCSSPCCGESSACLNEVSLFLLVFGAILGVLYSILFFREKHHVIRFPVVQRERIFRVKACLVPCFWQAVIVCFKSLRICYPFYFLFGFFARRIVRIMAGLERDRELTPLDSIYGLLDIRLFLFCIISGTLVVYVWILANKLFIVFHTEVLRFPIQAAFVELSGQSLPVALKCTTVPLLRYLAFDDLCQLSQFSAKRRKQIFSLSVPGGRPLNWLWVSEECLTLLNELKERIILDNQKHPSSVRNPTNSVWITPSRTFKDHASHNSSKTKSSGSFLKLRTKTHAPSSSQSYNSQSSDSWTERSRVKEYKTLISEKVNRFPLVRYLLEKREEVEMEDLFYDAQLEIWAAEGLSRLVAASFSEDVYGVVQKTLPFILSSLLELLQAVEVYLKRPSKEQNLFRARHPSGIRKTVHVLRDTLRCSVYRITETFKQHVSDIELTADNREFLKSFLTFQE